MSSKPHSEPRWAAGGNAEQTSWPTKSHPEPEVFWLTVEGHELDEPLVRKSALDAEHERWARAVDRVAIAESRMRGLEEQLEATREALADACDVAIWLSGLPCLHGSDAWPYWESDARPRLYKAMALLDSNPASSPKNENNDLVKGGSA